MASSDRISTNDARILEVLQRDGRRPYADLGAEVGMSGPSAHERVKKLEARGVIRGYAAIVDPAAVGDRLEAFVELYCADNVAPGDLLASVADLDAVVAAHTVAGDADAVVRVRVEGIEALERVIEQLRRDPMVMRTRTMVALSTLVERP